MTESKPARVLCMEDDAGQARLLKKRLERAGYTVTLAVDGEEGLAMYDAAPYDVIAVDQNMPICDGLEVLNRLASRGRLPPIIMVTGTGNERVAVEAMKRGAHDYIVKDVEGGYLELLPAVIEQVIRHHRLAEEKRLADEALRCYAAELEARNEELDAFAHTVAHDLKSPLAPLVGFVEVLCESRDKLSNQELERCYTEIWRAVNKLRDIVDELLLLAEVRKSEVKMAPLDMAGIVAEARRRLAHVIADTRTEIVAPDEWPLALGHAPWVEEIWVNYLSNAIKYGGRPPHVEFGCSISKVESRKSKVEIKFWVRDNGPGIAPKDQARLFTPFTRLGQARARGHGLGLSIVQRIAKKLDGQVGVESEPGQGSTFFFTLPPAKDAATPPAGSPAR